MYAELLTFSNNRLSDLDSLLDFIQSATNELQWLNEKEEIEVTRDWSDKNMNLQAVEKYYEVSYHLFLTVKIKRIYYKVIRAYYVSIFLIPKATLKNQCFMSLFALFMQRSYGSGLEVKFKNLCAHLLLIKICCTSFLL